ncbi:MAG: hypothetical protein FWG12_07960, partial [Holophagaceae bacterium]|nr:hypothetical protein [Holophagaceae bacterium]
MSGIAEVLVNLGFSVS